MLTYDLSLKLVHKNIYSMLRNRKENHLGFLTKEKEEWL